MLRLGRLTDYAIVLSTTLAERDGYSATARDLSQQTGIPRPTVIKLLKLLTRAQVLRSSQGRAGGYALARPPSGIGLTDVIEAIEGHIGLTECSRDSGKCEIQDHCPTHRHWLVINRAVREALQDICLSDLAGPAPARVPRASPRPFGGGPP